MDHFQNELVELKELLLRMASYAEIALQRSMEALLTRNYELALEVIEEDVVLDQFEVDVDETAVRLLAKAPLASDLRLISVAMKISQNLERVGDEATKIAKRARDLSQEAALKTTVPLSEMSSLSLRMLKGALDAFVRQDPAAARELIKADKRVDELNKQVHRDLVSCMISNPDSINRCLHFDVVAKSLERIADHAKNIAEYIVYLCEAEDIRHRHASQA